MAVHADQTLVCIADQWLVLTETASGVAGARSDLADAWGVAYDWRVIALPISRITDARTREAVWCWRTCCGDVIALAVCRIACSWQREAIARCSALDRGVRATGCCVARVVRAKVTIVAIDRCPDAVAILTARELVPNEPGAEIETAAVSIVVATRCC